MAVDVLLASTSCVEAPPFDYRGDCLAALFVILSPTGEESLLGSSLRSE